MNEWLSKNYFVCHVLYLNKWCFEANISRLNTKEKLLKKLMLLVRIKNKSCSLFNKQAIKNFKEKILEKALTRKGINTTVLLILKNTRFKVFEPSLLRMVVKSNPC